MAAESYEKTGVKKTKLRSGDGTPSRTAAGDPVALDLLVTILPGAGPLRPFARNHNVTWL
jgi:hypothetical protein